ncbi:hypothetical protein [Curtobacterium sp. MCBA15_012]|uniref:DUF7426 family protein n=1 Tax=Curtobacterium sp. MCBA15_012 TaxID=1898738 RepID=UPI0008DCFA23|nr:hypothetical protein [Curtobacterium sp. MCBA15_012]WIA99747.1 hypothetical protein QOL15_14730 [Curtobacterium sp. MCBA15_012]
MTFRDYYELADPLVLPIREKKYEIPPAVASDVLRYRIYLAKLEAGELTEADRIDDEDYLVTFLGTALGDMRADGVHPGVIAHAAQTALAEAFAGREIAETVWNAADPKAQNALLQAGLLARVSTPSTSTDEASTTS